MKKLLIILFWLIGITLNATTYYVATIGNDGNAGTIGSPGQLLLMGLLI